MPPARGAELIRRDAQRSVEQLAAGHRAIALPHGPYLVEIELSPMLDGSQEALSALPGTSLNGRTLTAKVERAAQAWELGVHAAAIVMPVLLAAHAAAR